MAQDYLLNNLKQTLTDEDKDSIEVEITLNEILIAIKSLANEKSPGCDGLTAEFYKTFCNVIGNDLVKVINNGFQQGELSITMRRVVIVLGRTEMLYLTTHSTHFIYGYMASDMVTENATLSHFKSVEKLFAL